MWHFAGKVHPVGHAQFPGEGLQIRPGLALADHQIVQAGQFGQGFDQGVQPFPAHQTPHTDDHRGGNRNPQLLTQGQGLRRRGENIRVHAIRDHAHRLVVARLHLARVVGAGGEPHLHGWSEMTVAPVKIGAAAAQGRHPFEAMPAQPVQRGKIVGFVDDDGVVVFLEQQGAGMAGKREAFRQLAKAGAKVGKALAGDVGPCYQANFLMPRRAARPADDIHLMALAHQGAAHFPAIGFQPAHLETRREIVEAKLHGWPFRAL